MNRKLYKLSIDLEKITSNISKAKEELISDYNYEFKDLANNHLNHRAIKHSENLYISFNKEFLMNLEIDKFRKLNDKLIKERDIISKKLIKIDKLLKNKIEKRN